MEMQGKNLDESRIWKLTVSGRLWPLDFELVVWLGSFLIVSLCYMY